MHALRLCVNRATLGNYSSLQSARGLLVHHIVKAGGANTAAAVIESVIVAGGSQSLTQGTHSPIVTNGVDVHVAGFVVLALSVWLWWAGVKCAWRCCCARLCKAKVKTD